jgi:primosomal protein N' (replication factor Y)
MEKLWYYLVTPLRYTGAASAFTYHSENQIEPGSVVEIPIGRRHSVGVVERALPRPEFRTKPINAVIGVPAVPAVLRALAPWLAEYYACSPAAAWNTMLPAGIAKTRRTPPEAGLPAAPVKLPSPALTNEQSQALATIRSSRHSSFLIQGVTGSGKTRLYLELAAEALAAGRSIIVLVPEITLTPQTVAAFEAAFGPRVLTSHSKLTEAKRHAIWLEAARSAAAGEPRIIIGPRSCLFMPTHGLGLIVIDECHETSYKQEQHPRYHAVTAAAKLARDCSARLVLGSATPGLSELFLAQSGRLEHISLTRRVNEIPHSQATILDFRNKEIFTTSKFIAQPLLDAIADTMTAGRQSLLYLNRRGSASSQVCGDCGHVSTCPNCALPLTFHADLLRLICHHCNFRRASDAVCPECGHANLRLIGVGTKRLEAEIEQLFPSARIARLDRDSATIKHIHQVLRDLHAGNLDIIMGTQMIAKGLDLSGLDTVGVINADTLLHLPDFSAAERTFQLLSQVSGRAGRGDRPGQVFIQTYTPNHPAITAAAGSDYARFAAAELESRRALGYPPFVFLLKLTVSAATRDTAMQQSAQLAAELRGTPGIEIAGPAPAFIEIEAGRYRWLITVKSRRRPPLVQIAANLPSPQWSADLDPINLL